MKDITFIDIQCVMILETFDEIRNIILDEKNYSK